MCVLVLDGWRCCGRVESTEAGSAALAALASGLDGDLTDLMRRESKSSSSEDRGEASVSALWGDTRGDRLSLFVLCDRNVGDVCRGVVAEVLLEEPKSRSAMPAPPGA